MSKLIEDKVDTIISTVSASYTGRQFAAYVEILEDKTENFVIGNKTVSGHWIEKHKFTTSEFLKLQRTLAEVHSYILTLTTPWITKQ